ncbi:UDP pyrophosphate phosphatase [Spirochaetia bacterium]|nr:UDP pyrophosphate phosphatase [Spirochaetia bacterium]
MAHFKGVIKFVYRKIVPGIIRSNIWRIKKSIGEFIKRNEEKYLFFYLRSVKKASKERLRPRELLRFEVNITDHCNLNCVGCEHFSPIAEKYFIDVDCYMRDCKRLSELTNCTIENLHLMGGEPLLHPEIIKIMEISRKYFQVGVIEIVTNGILLLKQKELFWEKCRENDIKISITQYPISINYGAIESKAKKYNVNLSYYFIGTKTMQKRPLDMRGRQDIENNFKMCHMSNNCIQLCDGKLYTCVVIAYIPIFNKYFNQSFEVTKEDYVDIYEVNNKKEIFDFLCKPVPFCKYCNIKKMVRGLDWSVSKKDISEWI